MENNLLFSVIVNAFNSRNTIERTLNSILVQTERNYELIVVDDGSTDGTSEVVAQYLKDQRVRLIKQENAGCPAARQTGIMAASAEFVTFLDSDDEAFPEWLSNFADSISASHCDIVCGGIRVIKQDGFVVERFPSNLGRVFNNVIGLFLPGTFAVRRSLLLAVGGYAPGSEPVDHTDFLHRLVRFSESVPVSIDTISKIVVLMHREGSNSYHPAALLKGVKYLLDRYPDHFNRDPVSLASYLAIAGVNCARLRRFSEARRYFTRAIRTHPRNAKHFLRLMISLFPPVTALIWKKQTGKSKLSALGDNPPED